MIPPFANIRPLDLAVEEAGTEQLLTKVMGFLQSFTWARQSGGVWVGVSIPDVIGVFLVGLEGSSEDIDPHIWVVVGDIPPAYISSEYAKTPKEAVEGYIDEMEAWIDAVENDKPLDEVIPVDAAPTLENASALRSRLSFMREKILPIL